MASAQSARTHCPQGHPYDDANTMIRGNGRRVCKTCQRQRYLASRPDPLPRVDKIWALVQKGQNPSGCWIWTGCIDPNGYGRYGRPSSAAHRLIYEMTTAPIPAGLTIDHLCRVRHCVNPSHMEPVSIATNVMRGESLPAKNARKTHCPQGHPYSEENTYVNPNSGHRLCRTCHRERALQRYYRMRGAS